MLLGRHRSRSLTGFSPLPPLCAAAAFIKALMEPVFNAHSQAIWQSITPRELPGRVFSVRRLIAQVYPSPRHGRRRHCCGHARSRTRVCRPRSDPGPVLRGAAGAHPYMLRVEDKAGLRTIGRIETLAVDCLRGRSPFLPEPLYLLLRLLESPLDCASHAALPNPVC